MTITAGIDLGQIKSDDPISTTLPAALRAKISLYLGKRGKTAEILIRNCRLTVTTAEADFLMSQKKGTIRYVGD